MLPVKRGWQTIVAPRPRWTGDSEREKAGVSLMARMVAPSPSPCPPESQQQQQHRPVAGTCTDRARRTMRRPSRSTARPATEATPSGAAASANGEPVACTCAARLPLVAVRPPPDVGKQSPVRDLDMAPESMNPTPRERRGPAQSCESALRGVVQHLPVRQTRETSTL